MAKKKKGSISLRPVVDAIDDTVARLIKAKKRAPAAAKSALNLRIKSIRGLRRIAAARCRALDLWHPPQI